MITTRQALNQPEGVLDLGIPRVRSGQYHLDVVARDGDRVPDSAACDSP
ncbi:MAG: hypothetical protein NTY19_16925 [Planctomycetota bacterium]|nr:hypothetical protein [Planctomycetota bacterium]